MTMWLKQSTAGTVKIGPFIDPTTGDAETSLTISQADVRLSKNGGNMAQKSDSSSCTHDEIGIYDCPLNTTDTGTLGRLQVYIHESGALPVWHDFMVVPANVYDSLVGGSDTLDVAATADNTEVLDMLAGLPLAEDMMTAGDFMEVLNGQVLDGTITRIQAERINLAFNTGKTTGAEIGQPKFYGQDGATVRINPVMDNGNRISVALDGGE